MSICYTTLHGHTDKATVSCCLQCNTVWQLCRKIFKFLTVLHVTYTKIFFCFFRYRLAYSSRCQITATQDRVQKCAPSTLTLCVVVTVWLTVTTVCWALLTASTLPSHRSTVARVVSCATSNQCNWLTPIICCLQVQG